METGADLFDYAIRLETAAGALYRAFARMFAGHPEVAAFWQHYAREEDGHADYLRRIREAGGPARLQEPAADFMLSRVHACLHKMEALDLSAIHTLEDAYELAVEVENSETNTIFEFIITHFSTEELARAHGFLRLQLDRVAELTNEFPGVYKQHVVRQKTLAAQIH